MKILAFFRNGPNFHRKSAENQLKIKIFKKAYVRSSVLMRWRSGPSLGVIQSSSSEKKFPPLNFKGKFYYMGNPIHFATFRERGWVRDITKFQHGKLFKFCEKFLNPCIPNFNTESFLNSVKSSWIPVFQILRYVKTRKIFDFDLRPPTPTPLKLLHNLFIYD